MKNIIKTTVLMSLLFLGNSASSQEINWKSLADERYIAHVNAGFLHGVVWGAGLGYQLKTKTPVILQAEYSFPSGNDLIDDFKSKAGGQVRVFESGNVHMSARLYGNFRRYENSLARLVNFGSEMSAAVGYYKPGWFLAGEFGFDKAIVTNFRHSAYMKDMFPEAQDGWFDPSTGGNFNYGLMTGFSFKSSDLYLKAGKVINQDFRTKPLVPFYLQLGYNLRINTGNK